MRGPDERVETRQDTTKVQSADGGLNSTLNGSSDRQGPKSCCDRCRCGAAAAAACLPRVGLIALDHCTASWPPASVAKHRLLSGTEEMHITVRCKTAFLFTYSQDSFQTLWDKEPPVFCQPITVKLGITVR